MSPKSNPKVLGKKSALNKRLAGALRVIHERKTAANVATDLQKAGFKVSISAVENWLSEKNEPSTGALEAMGEIYGVQFQQAVFPTWEVRAAESRQSVMSKYERLFADAHRVMDRVTRI